MVADYEGFPVLFWKGKLYVARDVTGPWTLVNTNTPSPQVFPKKKFRFWKVTK